MSFEERLGELYTKIAQMVNNMIPLQWETFFLNARLSDGGWATVYFYYRKPNSNGELLYSGNIPTDHNIKHTAYTMVLLDLIKLVQELRQAFIDEDQDAWYSFAMTVSSQGKMDAEFGYVDWQQSEYQEDELMNYHIYKHIDKKYIDSTEWVKMEEMVQYENKQT